MTKNKVIAILHELKGLKASVQFPIRPLPFMLHDKIVGHIRPITVDSARGITKDVKLLAEWRDKNNYWMPAMFRVTEEGTRKWLEEQVINNDDRVLFMVETADNIPVGHIGLARFDYENNTCDVDAVIRGDKTLIRDRGMTLALDCLMGWAFGVLEVKEIKVQVRASNTKALLLYGRLGFTWDKQRPLKRIVDNDVKRWVDADPYDEIIDDYEVQLKVERNNYEKD